MYINQYEYNEYFLIFGIVFIGPRQVTTLIAILYIPCHIYKSTSLQPGDYSSRFLKKTRISKTQRIYETVYFMIFHTFAVYFS